MSSREIERLGLRVKELEEQLREVDTSTKTSAAPALGISGPLATSPVSSPSKSLEYLGEQRGPRAYWEGIHTSSGLSENTHYYGPSSLFYYIGRMSSYLCTTLRIPRMQHHMQHHMQPKSASSTFATPACLPKKDGLQESCLPEEGSTTGYHLTGTQEDYFLNLFWQSYHCTVQIIDEIEFREHYRSLWAASATSRKPSALVDIVLALSMQHGVSNLPRSRSDVEPKASVDSNDATIAGRWLYRRSQMLLTCDLESPTINTLQCQILSTHYLCYASFHNMAHTNLALAVRTAQILGLHLEPPPDMSRNQKELRKRLWWTLYSLESKTCMKHGRPWTAQLSEVTCSLPADDHELNLLSASNFSFGQDVTWLTYTLQYTKLVLAARAIYTAFHDNCERNLSANNVTSLYNDPQSFKACAEFLVSSMGLIRIWSQDLPNALKTRRKGTGEPYSTDRSWLEMELFAPLWLRRQRLLLELLYHNLAMNLYRPFISFSGPSCRITKGNALLCVNHAITITDIMHQILSDTDLLNGWHETFQWQWNATLSMIGFILAYPEDTATPAVRSAIDSAIVVFHLFGCNIAVAANAANVTRDLTSKADSLLNRSQSYLNTSYASFSDNNNHSQAYSGPEGTSYDANGTGIFGSQDEESFTMDQNAVAGSIDMAFAIDSFDHIDPFWAGGVNLDEWGDFTQDYFSQDLLAQN